MAIHQSKHASDLDKRFRQLRTQLYGKQQSSQGNSENIKASVYSISSVATQGRSQERGTLLISDMENLNKSLKKIALLSSLAIGSQLLLYFLVTKEMINLNF